MIAYTNILLDAAQRVGYITHISFDNDNYSAGITIGSKQYVIGYETIKNLIQDDESIQTAERIYIKSPSYYEKYYQLMIDKVIEFLNEIVEGKLC